MLLGSVTVVAHSSHVSRRLQRDILDVRMTYFREHIGFLVTTGEEEVNTTDTGNIRWKAWWFAIGMKLMLYKDLKMTLS